MLDKVHKELIEGLEGFATLTLSDDNLEQVRAARRDTSARVAPLDGVRFEERRIPGPDSAPDVRVLIYQPETTGTGRPAVLHFHGGGLVIGLPEMGHDRNGMLVRELGCVVVSVDYRKAPEAPFPAGPEDGWAALTWLRANSDALGVDPRRIALLGESAGGCMAATLAILARERGGGPDVVFQALVFPMLDDRTGSNPVPGAPQHLIWTEASNRYGWGAYLGVAAGSDKVPPMSVPARQTDLTGLAPAWIGVGSIDLFVQENITYASRLLAADVECELVVVPGAYHAFQRQVPDAPVCRRFVESYVIALKRAFDVAGPA